LHLSCSSPSVECVPFVLDQGSKTQRLLVAWDGGCDLREKGLTLGLSAQLVMHVGFGPKVASSSSCQTEAETEIFKSMMSLEWWPLIHFLKKKENKKETP
jgi:hypothetical protein